MMSQTCEYALRAVSYIAANASDAPVMAKDVAAAMNIPLTYLQKVLRTLVRVNVLTSGRGIHGGFRLKRPPGEICLADVIMPFDDKIHLIACPFGNPRCGQANPCPVHDRWVPVVTAYRAFLATTTLEDLITRRPPGRSRRMLPVHPRR
jgi:Rrf2 family protein